MPPEQSTTTFIRRRIAAKRRPKLKKKVTGRASRSAKYPPSLPFSSAFLCLFVARPLVIAHRGASAEAPENTLAAFDLALVLGADGIELDVQTTRDGVPVVFHDATLARLTGQRGRIACFTREDLRAVRVQGEPIPSLAEVLALVRHRAVVQIEIKRGVPVAPVVAAVLRARAAAHVMFASFESAVVDEVRRLAPRIPRMLIAEGRGRPRTAFRSPPAGLLSTLTALAATGVSMDYRAIRSPDFIAALKSQGLCVWCWTVNRPHTMLRLATWGVDAILSDNPALLKSTLEGPH
jgi:glycerophosphoryl diester phosphodiesterase